MATDSPAANLRSRASTRPAAAGLAPPDSVASRSSAAKLEGSLRNGHSPAPPSERDVSQDRVDRGRPRSGLEIPRKLLHSSISVLVGGLWVSHPDVPFILRGSAVAFGVIAGADILRFRYPAFEQLYERLLGYFMRESERERVNGVIYYLGGVIITLTFYPRDIACLSIIILSLCDTAASVFGRLFGKYTAPLPFAGRLFGEKKSLAGTLAAILTGSVTAYVFWAHLGPLGDEGDLSWLPGRLMSTWAGPVTRAPTFLPRLPTPRSTLGLGALAGLNGLVAGVAEAFDVWGLDDNLTLPVLFGFGCWLVMWVLG